jgi:DeoR/GlpR family transcriptional regulator of sugar metabolism
LDDYGMDDIEVRKFLFNLSNENILLADSNKFLAKGTYNWTGFNKIKNIITDENLDGKIVSMLKIKNVNIVLAKKKNNK